MKEDHASAPPNPSTFANPGCQTSSQRIISYQSFTESKPSPFDEGDLFTMLMSLKFGSLSRPAVVGAVCPVHSGLVGRL